jgi:hypothetical protein
MGASTTPGHMVEKKLPKPLPPSTVYRPDRTQLVDFARQTSIKALEPEVPAMVYGTSWAGLSRPGIKAIGKRN